jgi:ABC-type nitrate/sulfonate/bicarbonate transport system permease component
VTMHSDDDRCGQGEGFRYPDCSNSAPSFHAFPETDPLRRDSITLLEAGRDDSNAWAKKFTELNRVGLALGLGLGFGFALGFLLCTTFLLQRFSTSSLPDLFTVF